MADYLPKHTSGGAVTFMVGAPVVGGRLVALIGERLVGPAVADSTTVVGVAGYDAEVNDSVTVYNGGVQQLLTAGAVPAGAHVAAGANGTIAATGNPGALGIALQPATSAGVTIEVLMGRRS
ncbi:capsid cement protein [Clavibacter zhangzhiyongii]|uniref:capsid cement protein n=1 Tax=Clavibacter zhangzhiyongii TaxID=2768071 RepID=UPI0039E04F6A